MMCSINTCTTMTTNGKVLWNLNNSSDYCCLRISHCTGRTRVHIVQLSLFIVYSRSVSYKKSILYNNRILLNDVLAWQLYAICMFHGDNKCMICSCTQVTRVKSKPVGSSYKPRFFALSRYRVLFNDCLFSFSYQIALILYLWYKIGGRMSICVWHDWFDFCSHS